MKALILVIKFGVFAAVISALSGTMKDSVMGMFDSVSVQAAHAEMEKLHGKLMEYFTTNTRYPQTVDELHGFLRKEFDKPMDEVLTDPWKNPYFFLTPKYEIVCFGPDKASQTPDDFGIHYPEMVKDSLQQRQNQHKQFIETWQKMYDATQRSRGSR